MNKNVFQLFKRTIYGPRGRGNVIQDFITIKVSEIVIQLISNVVY
jgi:hypothetical protein